VTDPKIASVDREAAFIDRELVPLLKHFPRLRIIFEHISTTSAVQFIKASSHPIAATITPHHLLLTQEDCQPLGPYGHCLPIIKSAADRDALVEAATSGNAKFFLGTDSAPHPKTQKQSTRIPAGIYSAPVALAIYTEIFYQQKALDKLEAFASLNGPRFYQLPINTHTITLVHKPTWVPLSLPFGSDSVVPLMAGQTLHWQIKHER
jgi:dihydroorotase